MSKNNGNLDHVTEREKALLRGLGRALNRRLPKQQLPPYVHNEIPAPVVNVEALPAPVEVRVDMAPVANAIAESQRQTVKMLTELTSSLGQLIANLNALVANTTNALTPVVNVKVSTEELGRIMAKELRPVVAGLTVACEALEKTPPPVVNLQTPKIVRSRTVVERDGHENMTGSVVEHEYEREEATQGFMQ